MNTLFLWMTEDINRKDEGVVEGGGMGGGVELSDPFSLLLRG